MRPYWLLAVVVLVAVAAFGQGPVPYSGACFYGCGPYVPRITTPELNLQQVSPNPVGASNATTGLIAGATNSTLSEVNGSTSSTYTVPVWLQGGGAPLISPEVQLWPEPIGREGRGFHGEMREGRPGEGRVGEEHGPRVEAHANWSYYSGEEYAAAPAGVAPKGIAKPGHVYNNDDINRLNEKNGMVKYDGKSEKI